MKVVETFGLSKTYVQDFIDVQYGRLKLNLRDRRVHALKDLTLEVDEGEIFGLLGPNGAGKTTTIKILMGIHFATAGKALLMGKPLGDVAVRGDIGFLPENPYFYDYLKGWEFLDFYGELYNMPKSVRRKKIEELLDLVGLSHAANLPLRGYSKGMNQRIGLAQTLLNDPKLVILDEPQSGLDPLGRKEVRDIILRLKSEGRTVLFSSHILSDAEMICDRVAIVIKGELQSIGSMKDLLSQEKNRWEVIVSGLETDALEQLKGKAKHSVVKDQGAILTIHGESELHGVLKEVISSGGHILSVVPIRETLEDYFIKQVKGDVA